MYFHSTPPHVFILSKATNKLNPNKLPTWTNAAIPGWAWEFVLLFLDLVSNLPRMSDTPSFLATPVHLLVEVTSHTTRVPHTATHPLVTLPLDIWWLDWALSSCYVPSSWHPYPHPTSFFGGIGVIEKNSFIALSWKGGHSGANDLETVSQPSGIWWGV